MPKQTTFNHLFEEEIPLKTFMPKAADITRKWYVVDAEGQVFGRVASQVASILRGKGITEGAAAVGAAIVDEQNFGNRIALPANGGHTALDIRVDVVYRNDNGQGCFDRRGGMTGCQEITSFLDF